MHKATVGDVSTALTLLAGAVALTLLLAAANVASLQLTRTAARRRELAVRVSLGASRLRLARELAAESVALAIAAGIAGVAIAYAALPALVAMLPANTPRTGEIAIDVQLVAAVIGATVLLALAVGLAPAIAATRTTSDVALRSSNSSEAPRAKRLRGAMVSLEIALAVMLAIGAGLMLQTLRNLHRVDTGFDSRGVLTFHLQPDPTRYGKSVHAFYEQILDRLRALPGVTTAGAIQHLPFSNYSWNASLDVEGVVVPDGVARPVAGLRIATPGYFEAVGQPMLHGRGFERADAERLTSVVVNAAFAKKYFGSEAQALGRTLRINGGRMISPWMTVVGVAGDVRHSSLTTEAVPEIYTSVGKTTITAMMVAVRASGEALALVPAIRDAVWSVDRDVPISNVETMDAKVATSVGRPRLLTSLLGSFAALGVLLAMVGVYSVVAYSVTQRRREIGIMVALGAERRRVAGTVLFEGARYAVAGLIIGIAAAVAASRYLRTLVFGVNETDVTTYAAMAALMLAIVAVACLLPAIRAARTDPALAVRQT
jgi:predicted permease